MITMLNLITQVLLQPSYTLFSAIIQLWFYTALLIFPLNLIVLIIKELRENKEEGEEDDKRVIPLAGDIYEIVTRPGDRDWFSVWDDLYRTSLMLIGFAVAIVSSPISFARYSLTWNLQWYGKIRGLLLTALFPVAPLTYLINTLYEELLGVSAFEIAEEDLTEFTGACWFAKPDGFFKSFRTSYMTNMRLYVGNFLIGGTYEHYVRHSYKDNLLTKAFYREVLESVGAKVPKQYAFWDGKWLSKELLDEAVKHDIVIKLNLSCYGIGDSFLTKGVDFTTAEDILNLLRSQYHNKPAILMELVRPKKSLGVHSLDIVTIRTPDNRVEVVSAMVWTNCSNVTSHSADQGYSIDIMTEKTCAPLKWYCPMLKDMTTILGTHYPGLMEAVQKCVRAHESMEYKWARMVGWDCMVMENDEMVFFEGNLADARGPRRIFLSFGCLLDFIMKYY